MIELLFFLFGGGVFSSVILLRQRATRRNLPKIENTDYKELWENAVNLLGATGSLSEDQIKTITAPKPTVIKSVSPTVRQSQHLPKGRGFSSNRRDIEIARAKAKLPPADNLEDMFSSDIKSVELARIQYGTAT